MRLFFHDPDADGRDNDCYGFNSDFFYFTLKFPSTRAAVI